MKIIQHREHKTSVSYSQEFRWKGESKHNGFGFPCNDKGEIDFDALPNAALNNLSKILFGEYNDRIQYDGIEKYEHSYNEPAIGKCDCGCEVILDGFTNTCHCGRDYNMSGQQLADRSQWGEETGEDLSDILRIS